MSSLVATILKGAGESPGLPLLHFEDPRGHVEVFDRARLRDDAARYARALGAAGVAPGDFVLLLFPDDHQTVGAFLGATCMGAVPAIYPMPGGAAARGDGAARGDLVRELVERDGFRVASSPDAARALAEAGCPAVGIADVPSPPDPDPPFHLPRAGDPAYIQLSSGTTGPPRGVLISHGAAARYPAAVSEALHLQRSDVSVGWIPLFHDMGLVSHLLNPLLDDFPSFHLSTARWMRRPAGLLQAVHRHGGTMTWMPNFAFRYCARRIRDEDLEGVDLSRWRLVGNGSEPVQIEVLDEFADRFAPYGFRREALLAGYGFAENVCGVTLSPPGRGPRVDHVSLTALASGRATPAAPDAADAGRVVSCGWPRPGVELRIADADDRPLGEREVGRIQIRSDTLFLGYVGDPAATRASCAGDWYRSGDLGYVADGELYVAGRERDLVIVGGRNVHPEVLEAVAAEPLGEAARRIAAFGIPDATGATEVPVVVCEAHALAPPEAARAARRIREAVLSQTGISLAGVRFVPKGWIVKSTSGKTARRACRDKYLAERAAMRPAEGDLEARVLALVEARLGVRLEEAGDDLCAAADSLQIAALLLEIEEIAGRRFAWEPFLAEPRTARLLEVLRSAAANGRGEPSGARRRARPRPIRARLHEAAVRPIPYAAGMAALRWAANAPRVRERLFRGDLALLRRFYDVLDDPLQSAEEFLRRAVSVALSRPLRDAKLGGRHRALGPWITLRPERHLEAAMDGGRGVVLLHSHFGAHRLAGRTALAAGRARTAIERRGFLRVPRHAGNRGALAHQILHGRRTLEAGGIVDIAGDGVLGKSERVILPFHGRRRGFRAGFAHLAESTGAAVLPVFSTIEPTGKIEVEIGPPLEPHGETAEERVRSLVATYAGRLEEAWRRDPANVPRLVMRHHLDRGDR